MDAFVVDASMAISWVHPAQTTSESEAWLEHVAAGAELVVPSIWPLEVANALLVLQRRRKVSAAERRDALQALGQIPARMDNNSVAMAFGVLSDLAAAESLSVYDASYLELAMRLRFPLSCGDAQLRAAARRNGVAVTP